MNRELPKNIRRALNQLAHARCLAHEIDERIELDKEMDRLLSQGMTAEEALQHVRNLPVKFRWKRHPADSGDSQCRDPLAF